MVEQDLELQRIYDKVVNNPSKESLLIKKFYPFGSDKPYLVSGQNAYFNNHIQQNGLNHIRVEKEDAKVIAMLHSLVIRFGHPSNYGDSNSIVYVTPPGTIELGYARQSFPSGILEDVFGWQGDRKYPFPWYTYFDDIESVDLIAGEDECDYWIRVTQKLLEIKKKRKKPIKFEDKEISEEQLENFMVRVRNVLNKFCNGYNRLYFLPLNQILNNKATYFAEKIREGSITGEDYEKELSSMKTLQQIIDHTANKDPMSFLKQLRYSESQWGIAILGRIESPIKYVEIKSIYRLLQEYFLNHGYKKGQIIDATEIYQLFDKNEKTDMMK